MVLKSVISMTLMTRQPSCAEQSVTESLNAASHSARVCDGSLSDPVSLSMRSFHSSRFPVSVVLPFEQAEMMRSKNVKIRAFFFMDERLYLYLYSFRNAWSWFEISQALKCVYFGSNKIVTIYQ